MVATRYTENKDYRRLPSTVVIGLVRKTGYKLSPKPKVLPPLAYDYRWAYTPLQRQLNPNSVYSEMTADSSEWDGGWASLFTQRSNSAGQVAYNTALDRAVSQLGNLSQLGTALAELGETMNLIGTRALQLRKAYKSLRKGDIRAFFRQLKIRPHKRHKSTRWSKPKDASSLWLEYWMGWAPLVGDIYSAIEVLQRPLPMMRVVGTSRVTGSRVFNSDTSTRWNNGRSTSVGFAKVSFFVTVSNPNAWLANQLGLVNPVLTAWELVPFSFVVNWFWNVDQWLGHFSTFWGLEVTQSYATLFARSECHRTYAILSGGVLARGVTGSCDQVYLKRTLGVPSPTLNWMPPRALSPTRAATSVSLLLSMLTKG